MKPRPIIPPAVSQRQHDASDPLVSAWASANAGSGKTHVLTQRVIKLLLGGEDPAKILCITFTKAAAATMATRVFNTLGEWTALDDGALDQAIRDIGAVPDARSRKRARQLFALALETPGGLKVQTIHAFCTRLLHQFPFEAGVGAGFEVLDDATQSQMLETLTLDVMLEGAAEPKKPLGQALGIAIRAAADQTFRDIIREAVKRRDEITGWVARTKSVEGAIAELSKALGIDPNMSAEAIEARILSEASIAFAEWPDLAAVYRIGSKTDQGHADTLDLARGSEGRERLLHYLSIFCTKEMQPRKSLATKKIKDAHPSWVQRLEEEQTRICDLLGLKNAAECRDRTRALVTVAHEVIERYRKAKARRGRLDYDDLIDRTLDLFRRTSAAWVLYKLDLGIDHILVDEAQDTSPKQWEIIETLVGEFTSGAGARGMKKRTLFVVGDDKQSIFSFQGAAPEKFGAMKHKFASDFSAADLGFRDVSLLTSFRSSEIVLNAVDTVFGREIAYRGLSSDPARTVHEHLPGALPGSVEIWPLEQADPKRDISGWDAPFDLASETSPQVRLAKRIARHVAIWRSKGGKPGDVLVLVRQRGALFEQIIRALKESGIPVAGADRMVLTEHIAIMDLMVLADALLLPEDDLALATVLKSPLVGLSEEDLFDIAWNRGSLSLRAALLAKESKYPEAAARLKEWSEAASHESPFTFYSRLLGPRGGRKRLLARLGPEANDALDEFLNFALDYEKRETPSLQGFIAWLREAKTEVKRDMEMGRDEVRVMTVHGAKGLEAHTVILADTTTPPAGHHSPRLIQLPLPGGDGIVWAGKKGSEADVVEQARQSTLDLSANEYRRLLYVAMTRAERRLVICGTARAPKENGEASIPDECWYRLIEGALVGDGLAIEVAAEDDAEKKVHRYRKSEPVVSASPSVSTTQPETAAPDWLYRPVGPEPKRFEAITPSDSDETALPRGALVEREQARERGKLMHRLIQSLPDIPPEKRQQAAREFMSRNGDKLPEQDRETIADQALAILADPRFAKLFEPGSRAEVPLVGTLPRPGLPPYAVTGQVDRLLVGASEVLIADYKTNRPPPADLPSIPGSYKRQLALYRALLQRIYPGKTVRAALVFTESPILLEIPAEMLDAELATLTGVEGRRA
jgi:ATP-dependent helicase/nuclease subunit A